MCAEYAGWSCTWSLCSAEATYKVLRAYKIVCTWNFMCCSNTMCMHIMATWTLQRLPLDYLPTHLQGACKSTLIREPSQQAQTAQSVFHLQLACERAYLADLMILAHMSGKMHPELLSGTLLCTLLCTRSTVHHKLSCDNRSF